MTYFEDLTPYTYLVGHASGPEEEPWPGFPLVNVGWLEPGRPFRTGATPDALIPALETAARLYRVRQTRGFHMCGLCPSRDVGAAVEGRRYDQEMIRRGSAQFRVRGLDVVYAAPQLTIHYVSEHGYLPPNEFCVAAVNQANDL